MRAFELYKINKLYFGHEEISRVLGISLNSSKLSAHRYTQKGLLVRVKRNTYILRERWRNLDRVDKFRIANLIQVPSYISLMSALDYYQITTQIQQDFIESIAVKRTKETEIEKNIFNYSKIKLLKNGMYLAECNILRAFLQIFAQYEKSIVYI